METVTVTLTDFLLARIAEDEEVVFADFRRYDIEMIGDTLSGAYHGSTSRPRVLAECEAKRRIVELFPSSPDGDGWNEAGGQVLALLALPFAEHPDYRQEWKP